MINQSMQRALRALEEKMPEKTRENFEMGGLTSFRLGGAAAAFVIVDTDAELEGASEILRAEEVPAIVLGRGTNLLISDRGYPGVVIQLGKGFDWIRSKGNLIEAGGMTPLPQVSNRASRMSLEGMEFAIAIPATVGGAVRMNAGAHGSSVSEVIASAVVFRLLTGDKVVMTPSDLRMDYRHTGLGPTDVVTSAVFHLQPGDKEMIASRMNSYRMHRTETQPVEAPNAGSMFRNPAGTSAGRLIESLGLKGRRVGNAEVSQKHANFFLAGREATAQDVFDLMALVQREVESKTGILLIPEVRTMGEFDRADSLRTQ